MNRRSLFKRVAAVAAVAVATLGVRPPTATVPFSIEPYSIEVLPDKPASSFIEIPSRGWEDIENDAAPYIQSFIDSAPPGAIISLTAGQYTVRTPIKVQNCADFYVCGNVFHVPSNQFGTILDIFQVSSPAHATIVENFFRPEVW